MRKKRNIASYSSDELAVIQKEVVTAIAAFAKEEVKGSRAGFKGAKPFTVFIASGENDGWDMVTLVRGFKVSFTTFSEDLLAANGKIVFDEIGELSSDGAFLKKGHKDTLELHMIFENDKWMIQNLPDGYMPRVLPKAAIVHFRQLEKTAAENKDKKGIEGFRKIIHMLKKLK